MKADFGAMTREKTAYGHYASRAFEVKCIAASRQRSLTVWDQYHTYHNTYLANDFYLKWISHHSSRALQLASGPEKETVPPGKLQQYHVPAGSSVTYEMFTDAYIWLTNRNHTMLITNLQMTLRCITSSSLNLLEASNCIKHFCLRHYSSPKVSLKLKRFPAQSQP